MRILAGFGFGFVALLLGGCVSQGSGPLEAVERVELEKYAGTWYEIASFPTSFQRNCTGTTATYTIADDGAVTVFNRCFLGSLEGRENTITGRARPVDDSNARLAVSFSPLFEAPYWIIALDDQYQYAMVGEPTRSFLWILSRTPQLDDATYTELIQTAESKGFDTAKLRRTVQPEGQ